MMFFCFWDVPPMKQRGDTTEREDKKKGREEFYGHHDGKIRTSYLRFLKEEGGSENKGWKGGTGRARLRKSVKHSCLPLVLAWLTLEGCFYLQRVCQSHHSLLKQRPRRPIAPAFRQTERGKERGKESGKERRRTSIPSPRLGPSSRASLGSSEFFGGS